MFPWSRAAGFAVVACCVFHGVVSTSRLFSGMAQDVDGVKETSPQHNQRVDVSTPHPNANTRAPPKPIPPTPTPPQILAAGEDSRRDPAGPAEGRVGHGRARRPLGLRRGSGVLPHGLDGQPRVLPRQGGYRVGRRAPRGPRGPREGARAVGAPGGGGAPARRGRAGGSRGGGGRGGGL